jgi:hypothetical protein
MAERTIRVNKPVNGPGSNPHLRGHGERGEALGPQQREGHVAPHPAAGRRVHSGGGGGGGGDGGRRQLDAGEEEDDDVGYLRGRRGAACWM